MAFHFEIFKKKTSETFEILNRSAFISDFYLAGGTALALWLGHRYSYDLDFFTNKQFNELKLARELIKFKKFQVEKKSEQTIIGNLNATKISFLGYPYPLISPLPRIKKIKIAGLLDIACMKIDAIASRGTKRDFIDVYFIVREIPLNKILRTFKTKYARLNYNMLHIKKALVYFADADQEPMPSMLRPVNWREVKRFFKAELIKLKDN